MDDLKWRKSTRSSTNGGACIEVATAPRTVAVRDSKDPNGPKLAFARGSWQEFTRHVKSGSDPA